MTNDNRDRARQHAMASNPQPGQLWRCAADGALWRIVSISEGRHRSALVEAVKGHNWHWRDSGADAENLYGFSLPFIDLTLEQ